MSKSRESPYLSTGNPPIYSSLSISYIQTIQLSQTTYTFKLSNSNIRQSSRLLSYQNSLALNVHTKSSLRFTDDCVLT